MHPPYLLASLALALTLTACGSKGDLTYPPRPDGSTAPTTVNPNTLPGNFPQTYPPLQTRPQ